MADAVYDIAVRDQTKQGLDSSEKEVQGFAGRIKKIVSGLTPTLIAGAAAAGLVAGAIGLIRSRVGQARELRNFAQIAQVSTTFLQENAIALRRTGAEQEDFIDGLREMQLRLAEAAALGSGPAVDALQFVGLTLEDIIGLKAPERFDLIRKRIAAIEDPARRLFVAEELLGGSSERLQGFLALTAEQLAEYRREAHETGQVLSEDTVADLLAAGEAWDKFSGRLSGFLNQVLAAMIPGLTAILDFVEQTMIPTLDVVIGNIIAVVQAAAEGDWKEVWELMGDAVGIGSGEPGDRGQTLVDEIGMIIDGAISAVQLAGQGEWREAWAAWQEGVSFVPQQSVREYVLLGAFLYGASRLVVSVARGAWAAAWVVMQLAVGFIPGGRLAIAKLSALLIAANTRVIAAGGPWRLAWIALRAAACVIRAQRGRRIPLALTALLAAARAIVSLQMSSGGSRGWPYAHRCCLSLAGGALQLQGWRRYSRQANASVLARGGPWRAAWVGVRALVGFVPVLAAGLLNPVVLAVLVALLAAAVLYVYIFHGGDWSEAWQAVQNRATQAWEFIKLNSEAILSGLIAALTLLLPGVPRIVTAMFKGVLAAYAFFKSGDYKNAPAFFRGIANSVIGYAEGMANGVIGALNAIIRAWNNLSLTLPCVELFLAWARYSGAQLSKPRTLHSFPAPASRACKRAAS